MAQRTCRRKLTGEQLETRLCLSTIGFASHVIEVSSAASPNDIELADINGDGHLDLLAASSNDRMISWFENIDGRGRFVQRVVGRNVRLPRSVTAEDLDGDGDLDVVAGSLDDDPLFWYENTDGRGSFGAKRVIATSADSIRSVFAADFDGDGDKDVLAASPNDGSVFWLENVDGTGEFAAPRNISDDGGWSVFASDLDGDDDLDVLVASGNDDTVAWYENMDGRGTFGLRQVVTSSADQVEAVSATDVDGDGDMDVLSAGDRSKTSWYENLDGRGNFGLPNRISGGKVLATGDIDGDGDEDAVSADAWYENVDGLGNFGDRREIARLSFPDIEAVAVGDVDGDEDADVLVAVSTYSAQIIWFENLDGQGTFGPEKTIARLGSGADHLAPADIDLDGDLDLIAADYWNQNVSWYENLDGRGTFGQQQLIFESSNTPLPRHVFAADVDGDGDVDVLAASDQGDITWRENMDSRGTFGNRRVIASDVSVANTVSADDFDGDGDLDVLISSRDDISWYENTNGNGEFQLRQRISQDSGYSNSSIPADVDGDGDSDVIFLSDRIAWHENMDGRGTFGSEQVISPESNHASASGVFAMGDVDGDGDLDVVATDFLKDRVVWFENQDGRGGFGDERVIDEQLPLVTSVFSGDMDNDGDLDILSVTHVNGTPSEVLDSRILWHENIDGCGNFATPQIVARNAGRVFFSFGRSSVHAADMDNDGDLDVLSALPSNLIRSTGVGQISWYENRPMGDSNNDGVFNSSDLVTVFQAGEYEDRGFENSTFDEGDWNGDGEFNSSDLVKAFQAGTYSATVRMGELAAAIDFTFSIGDDDLRPLLEQRHDETLEAKRLIPAVAGFATGRHLSLG